MSPRPGLIIVCVYVWEEKEEILIIERVEMIVDDDEVGSKRLISYKIYGCQENKAGYFSSAETETHSGFKAAAKTRTLPPSFSYAFSLSPKAWKFSGRAINTKIYRTSKP